MGSVGPIRADIAQVVEHFHGKEKVASASLAVGSNGMNSKEEASVRFKAVAKVFTFLYFLCRL